MCPKTQLVVGRRAALGQGWACGLWEALDSRLVAFPPNQLSGKNEEPVFSLGSPVCSGHDRAFLFRLGRLVPSAGCLLQRRCLKKGSFGEQLRVPCPQFGVVSRRFHSGGSKGSRRRLCPRALPLASRLMSESGRPAGSGRGPRGRLTRRAVFGRTGNRRPVPVPTDVVSLPHGLHSSVAGLGEDIRLGAAGSHSGQGTSRPGGHWH